MAATALGLSLAFSACYTGDQSCSEAYNQNDPNDHCPYGPPGGPKAGDESPKCPEITKKTPGTADCQVSGHDITFDDVYPRLAAANGGNCSGQGTACHGKYSYKGIDIFDTPPAMLDALAAYKGELGNAQKDRTYFNPTLPHKSWWVCNLRGDEGKLMPTGQPRMNAADIALVERWLACGAAAGTAAKQLGEGGSQASGSGGEGGSTPSGQGGAGAPGG